MSEQHAANTGNGASGAAAKPKRQRIATSNVNGSMGQIKFSEAYGNVVVEIDATRIPGGADVTGKAAEVLAYGAVGIVQISYNNSDTPVETARAMLAKLYAGAWKPGNPRAGAPKQPDELILALAEHLKMEPDAVEDSYIPKYMHKHGYAAAGPARRALRAHPAIAPIVARIVAERARQTAAAVKGQHAESLTL